MKELVGLIVVLLVVTIGLELLNALRKLQKSRGHRVERLPYRRKDWLLSKAERSFYEVLRTALSGSDLVIFPKVRLLDLLWLPQGTSNRQSHLNRVISKHVDFVLCDRQHLRPLLVIELDDASHEQEDRQERDGFVDQVLAAAALPILHVPAHRSYHTGELTRQVQAKIATHTQ